MALDAIDHFLLGYADQQNRQWAEQKIFRTRELREDLAKTAAANQGRKAIIDALVAAYNANDWVTIENILGDYERRRVIYQAAYFPTLNSMMPT
ncbi:MAG: hypothetical protein H6970_15365 [Gammaproteobacteria bacterium]|nr:hypothetical protein [Gammaproteobacteria bacterium]MCP5458719.1 hypothetical protein [Gammaproteobacteria bacterium]